MYNLDNVAVADISAGSDSAYTTPHCVRLLVFPVQVQDRRQRISQKKAISACFFLRVVDGETQSTQSDRTGQARDATRRRAAKTTDYQAFCTLTRQRK